MNYSITGFKHYAACIAALFFSTIFSAQVLAERIELDIADSGVRKIVVAVPPFADAQGNINTSTGIDIAKLVARGLDFHGFIQIIDPIRYSAGRIVDWNSLGADFVVMGKYSAAKKNMTIEAALFDVVENKTLPGKRYQGSISQQNKMTKRLIDSIIKDFTGEAGVSQTSIAFISDATGRKEVYMADVLGQKFRQVTRHNHLCVSPRFSPHARYLAYSSYHRANQNLYITELSQNKTTRVLSRRDGMNLAPAFSPDGKTMVVTLSKDGNPDLYLMDRQGKVLSRLTQGSGINVSASFSPDGQQIAFVSDRTGKPQVYIMDLQSKRVHRLTFQGKENAEPSWSPKGDRIAYTSLVAGHYQIFTIPVNGNSPSQISSGFGDFESPTWSPDGKQIAFSRKRNGHQEICAVFADGKGLRTLFKLKGNQSYPQWAPRSRE
jgi:TolB protein